jgi:pimeloyl-ACP methyl ester carboxylesterase
MPTITIARQELYYTRARARDERARGRLALLLIHGAGGTHLDWPAELRRMDRAGVYAPDLPGHGRSAPPGRDQISDYAAVIAELVQQLQLAPVVLAGHSMGAAIAQELALQQPDWLAGLVLIGAGARMPVNPRLLEQATADFPATVAFLTRYFWTPEAPQFLVEAGRAQLMRNDPKVLAADFLACSRFDRRADVQRIAVPALLITGTADKMMPLEHAEYLAGAMPRAELLPLAGAAHMVMLEDAGAVGAAVAGFLDRLPAVEDAQ